MGCWRAMTYRAARDRNSCGIPRCYAGPTHIFGTGQGVGPMTCFCASRPATTTAVQVRQARPPCRIRSCHAGEVQDMRSSRNSLLTITALAGGMIAGLLAPAPAAYAQADRTFVMKLGVATINDTQHEWLQAVRGGGREGFRRPHQGRNLSGEPARPDPAADRRRAVRLDPGLDGPAGIPGRRRRALRGAERARPDERLRPDGEGALRSGRAEDDVRTGRAKGLEGIGFAPIGPSSIITKKEVKRACRPQGHEASRAGLAVPARADPADGRQSRSP